MLPGMITAGRPWHWFLIELRHCRLITRRRYAEAPLAGSIDGFRFDGRISDDYISAAAIDGGAVCRRWSVFFLLTF